MADLRANYLGLSLRNPILASSCGITGTVSGVKQCADAGVGAVVLESLFEEQISAEMGGEQGHSGSAFPDEARAYLRDMAVSRGPEKYLGLIRECKQAVDIPVIASVNCVSGDRWTDYAARIEAAGADALELNIAFMPLSLQERAQEIEEHVFSIVREVCGSTTLPITVKIGPYFTALPRVIATLVEAGAGAVVLFNRFYQLDIDPVTLTPVPGNRFSTSDELPLPLRWMSILSPKIACDFSLSTGVHTGLDAAKSILAGASVVQIASALYVRKIRSIATILSELDQWLDANGYQSVEAARGRFATSDRYRPEDLERMQYIKALTTRR